MTMPVPLNGMLTGEFGTLPAICNAALSEPSIVGKKSTEITQVAPAVTPLHVFAVMAKASGLVPARAVPAMVSGTVPVLVSVSDCATEVAPTLVAANVSNVGDMESDGTPPVPCRVNVVAFCVIVSVTE